MDLMEKSKEACTKAEDFLEKEEEEEEEGEKNKSLNQSTDAISTSFDTTCSSVSTFNDISISTSLDNNKKNNALDSCLSLVNSVKKGMKRKQKDSYSNSFPNIPIMRDSKDTMMIKNENFEQSSLQINFNCPICKSGFIEFSSLEVHVESCISYSDKASIKADKDEILCPICNKDLTRSKLANRETHINKCLDNMSTNSANKSNQINKQDDLAYLSQFELCPVCSCNWSFVKVGKGRSIKNNKDKFAHIKQCSELNKINYPKLFDTLSKAQENQELLNEIDFKHKTTRVASTLERPKSNKKIKKKERELVYILSDPIDSDDDVFEKSRVIVNSIELPKASKDELMIEKQEIRIAKEISLINAPNRSKMPKEKQNLNTSEILPPLEAQAYYDNIGLNVSVANMKIIEYCKSKTLVKRVSITDDSLFMLAKPIHFEELYCSTLWHKASLREVTDNHYCDNEHDTEKDQDKTNDNLTTCI